MTCAALALAHVCETLKYQVLPKIQTFTLLSTDQIKMVKKDLQKYSKIFEQKDRLSQSKASKV